MLMIVWTDQMQAERRTEMFNVFLLLMLLSEIIAASSQMLLKKSANKEHSSFIKEYLNPYVIIGYGLLVLSMVICIVCYGDDKLGYMGTVVMEPVNYVLVMIMSRFIFWEKITSKKVIGALLIIGGIMVFNILG